MVNLPIKLVKDTISNKEIDLLRDWLSTYPKLTKGDLTVKFEQNWSDWLGVKYSVFVNSGSSANLAMAYALKLSGKLKNNKVIAPCISWCTTVSPFMQLGFDVILCDADNATLGLDVNKFEELCKIHNPGCVVIVHVLGIPNKNKEIQEICKKYDVILLEDSCESVGTLYDGKKTGEFGIMSTFSTYYGHHFSTIEGGIVSTDSFELYEILKSIRAHGWSRDLSADTQTNLKDQYNIDDFNNLYTFYYPGFNVRPTDLQAFIGLNQITDIDSKNSKRYNNFLSYQKHIINNFWKINYDGFVSNFAYPVVHPKKYEIIEALNKHQVECRPLLGGSISRQPFYTDVYGHSSFEVADKIHDYGFYLPNNPDMSIEDISYICNIINQYTTA
jgi:CDP-4-dehydro-6-deoxyglucose reductase, E1